MQWFLIAALAAGIGFGTSAVYKSNKAHVVSERTCDDLLDEGDDCSEMMDDTRYSKQSKVEQYTDQCEAEGDEDISCVEWLLDQSN